MEASNSSPFLPQYSSSEEIFSLNQQTRNNLSQTALLQIPSSLPCFSELIQGMNLSPISSPISRPVNNIESYKITTQSTPSNYPQQPKRNELDNAHPQQQTAMRIATICSTSIPPKLKDSLTTEILSINSPPSSNPAKSFIYNNNNRKNFPLKNQLLVNKEVDGNPPKKRKLSLNLSPERQQFHTSPPSSSQISSNFFQGDNSIKMNPTSFKERGFTNPTQVDQANIDKQTLQNTLKSDPFNPEILYQLAKTSIIKNNYGEAIQYLNLLTYYHPTHEKGWCHLGYLNFLKRNYKNAFRAFEIAANRNPHDITINFNLAKTHVKSEKYQQACQIFQYILTLSPNHIESQVELGLLFIKVNSLNDAFQHLHKALTQQPHHFAALRGLAGLYLIPNLNPILKGNIEKFINNPQQPILSIGFQATLRFRQQKYSESLHFFEQAVQISTNHEEFLLSLGICYFQQKKTQLAIQTFNCVHAVNKNNILASHFLSTLYASNQFPGSFYRRLLIEQIKELSQNPILLSQIFTNNLTHNLIYNLSKL